MAQQVEVFVKEGLNREMKSDGGLNLIGWFAADVNVAKGSGIVGKLVGRKQLQLFLHGSAYLLLFHFGGAIKLCF